MKKRPLYCTFLLAPALAFAIHQAGTQDNPQIVWGDFDGDGLPDLLAVESSGSVRIHRNLGDGTFEDTTDLSGIAAASVKSASWQDVDGDGHQDLYLVQRDGKSLLYRGLGLGQFEDATETSGLHRAPSCTRASWVDYDQDGHPDLELWSPGGVRLLHNDGRGVLQETRFEWTPFVEAPPVLIGQPGVEPLNETASVERPGSPDVAVRPGTKGAAGPHRSSQGTGSKRQPVGRSNHGGASGSSSTESFTALPFCPPSLRDDAQPSACLTASSVPTPGMLYPLGSDFFVDSSGYVGVGSLNPRSNMHVRSSGQEVSLRLNTFQSEGTAKLMLLENNNGESNLVGGQLAFDGALNQLQLSSLGSGTEKVRMVIDRGNGDVGINTLSPVENLHVVGNATVGTILIAPNSTGTGNDSQLMLGEDDDGTFGMKVRYDGSDNLLRFKGVSNGVENTHMTIGRDTGRVGIGVANPSGTLEVIGNLTGVAKAALVATNTNTGAANAIRAETNGSGTTVILEQLGSGAIFKGNTTAGTVFKVNNSGRVVTTALEITGGGDLVEGFQSDEDLEPGTVVAVDPDDSGRLVASHGRYDSRVVGVVSGAGGVNHGIRMGQEDVLDGDTLVAMAGRVYVRCATENGPIRPGDLLTSATVDGCAMRATDAGQSFGAVIGKALSGLDSGSGLVLVLVNLQ